MQPQIPTTNSSHTSNSSPHPRTDQYATHHTLIELVTHHGAPALRAVVTIHERHNATLTTTYTMEHVLYVTGPHTLTIITRWLSPLDSTPPAYSTPMGRTPPTPTDPHALLAMFAYTLIDMATASLTTMMKDIITSRLQPLTTTPS